MSYAPETRKMAAECESQARRKTDRRTHRQCARSFHEFTTLHQKHSKWRPPRCASATAATIRQQSNSATRLVVWAQSGGIENSQAGTIRARFTEIHARATTVLDVSTADLRRFTCRRDPSLRGRPLPRLTDSISVVQ